VLTFSGAPLPRILAADRDLLSVAFEDLGDLLLADAFDSLTPRRAAEVYSRAGEIAASIGVEGTSRVTPGHPLATRPLARERLRVELAFFATHDVAGRRGIDDRELLRRLASGLDLIADETDRLPRELAHRDFHARNILLRPDGGLGVVDFQDALLAPKYYDLVSLVFDPYVPVDRELRRSACTAWSARRASALDPEEDPGFYWAAVQRVLKALGTYAFQATVRANKRFGPSIAPAERTALDLAGAIDERTGTRLHGLFAEIGFGS
jgi:aminoglycoside/choline kinase family phosphotransferase